MRIFVIVFISILIVLSMVIMMCALLIGASDDKYMTDKEKEYYV